jgi:hypothetical protein
MSPNAWYTTYFAVPVKTIRKVYSCGVSKCGVMVCGPPTTTRDWPTMQFIRLQMK